MSNKQQSNNENSHSDSDKTIITVTTRLNPFTTANSSTATTVEQIHAQPNIPQSSTTAKKYSTLPSLHRRLEEVTPTIFYNKQSYATDSTRNNINTSIKKEYARRRSAQSIFNENIHHPLFERGELVTSMNLKLRNKEEKYNEMENKGKEIENMDEKSSKIETGSEERQEDDVAAMVKITRDDVSDDKWQ
ncbi:11736_t:CDS:1 [Ambispora leptoticha]|uniref:11736_t:CDS:1 n=1 Tax=Ambispora leptoticha TaxID=144679 RepID=A0A9N9HDN8_9GLOM|nr:11736_t:CDS:1 [Ambispora leptoticha]